MVKLVDQGYIILCWPYFAILYMLQPYYKTTYPGLQCSAYH